MSNEHLGIYEALRAKSKPFEGREAERKRLMQMGPADNGAYAEPVNPFVPPEPPPPPATVNRDGGGYIRPLQDKQRGRRAVWPESELGVSIGQILQAVCIESGLSQADLFSVQRGRKFAWPRHVCMWMIDRYCPSYALVEIAHHFNRDHTSVMHAINATTGRLRDGEPSTVALVDNVHARLRPVVQP